MLDVHLPQSLWVETLFTVVYLINQLPPPNTKILSPYQLFHNQPPQYDHLQVLGVMLPLDTH